MTERNWTELAEYITVGGSFVGAIATFVTKEVMLTATPLTLALTLNILNRQKQVKLMINNINESMSVLQTQGVDSNQIDTITKKVELLSQSFHFIHPLAEKINHSEQSLQQLTETVHQTETKTDHLSQLLEENEHKVAEAVQLIHPLTEKIEHSEQSLQQLTQTVHQTEN